MTRELRPLLAATDASPSFGFGASVCGITPEEAVELGTYAHKRRDFAGLQRDGTADDEDKKPLAGVPLHVRIV